MIRYEPWGEAKLRQHSNGDRFKRLWVVTGDGDREGLVRLVCVCGLCMEGSLRGHLELGELVLDLGNLEKELRGLLAL